MNKISLLRTQSKKLPHLLVVSASIVLYRRRLSNGRGCSILLLRCSVLGLLSILNILGLLDTHGDSELGRRDSSWVRVDWALARRNAARNTRKWPRIKSNNAIGKRLKASGRTRKRTGELSPNTNPVKCLGGQK